MEGFQDFARGIVHRDGAAVGATHGAIGSGQGAQQPFHLGGVQVLIDLDGGAAGDGGADVAAEIVERGAAEFGFGNFQNLDRKSVV